MPRQKIIAIDTRKPGPANWKTIVPESEDVLQFATMAADQIVLADIRPVVWRDAGLGCPKPGVDYMQVETPGYTILLAAGGTAYRYHTDETKRFVPCAK